MDKIAPFLGSLDPFRVVFALACVFGAAIVRGYSGFGFSLLTITALSLVFRLAEVVPAIFMLEIAASLHLMPGIWRDIQWRSLGPLVLGCTFATPFGVAVMAHAPVAPLQLGLAAFVMIATILMWHGFALKRAPGPAAALATGSAAGFANGAIGIGGPPVILFYFSSPAGALAGRASLIAFFFVTDAIGLLFQTRAGLITGQAILLAALFLPALLAGVWLGSRSFKTANPDAFRRWILILLMAMAVVIALKAIASL